MVLVVESVWIGQQQVSYRAVVAAACNGRRGVGMMLFSISVPRSTRSPSSSPNLALPREVTKPLIHPSGPLVSDPSGVRLY